jgi:SNF2 family DNA or RNA helicase
MGLGKTAITLTAVNDLKYNRFDVSRVLVIAPKKVAESTWSKETQKWDHLKHLRVVKALGTEKQRIRALNTPADVWVINRENVPWLVEYSLIANFLIQKYITLIFYPNQPTTNWIPGPVTINRRTQNTVHNEK